MKSSIEKYIAQSVKTSIFGLFFALLMGLFVREMTRGLKGSISLYDFDVVSGFLELAHGHALVFFCIVPLVLGLIFFLLKDQLTSDISYSKLSMFTGIMHLGMMLTLILMIYKGLAYVSGYQTTPDLTQIDANLFGGITVLRALAYAVAHISMTVGVFGVGILALKAMKPRK